MRGAGDPLDAALDGARRGDEAAFLLLWRSHQPRLLRYLSLAEGASAEDIASETWLQVVRDLPRFSGDAEDFRRWLYTLARHRAIDAGRARSRAPVTLLREVTDDLVEPTAALDDQALERLSTARALSAVRSLPVTQADMVGLRVLAGLDVATVADLVGRSPGAVRVAVHRALHVLANHPDVQTAREEAR